MTLDDAKRVFHATPPEFAPYLEYAYHLQKSSITHGVRPPTRDLEPTLQDVMDDPLSVLAPDVATAAAKVIYHVDADIDFYLYGSLWRRFLAFMGVRESESVKGRLAYYQSTERRQSNTLTPIKIRRFLTKYDVFNEWGDRQAGMQEIFSRYLDNAWEKTDILDVRTLDHDDVDGWDEAFNKIRSCMSRASEHGVGVRNSYLCYMTKYHGLDDNDVRLTVLYQHGEPVARTLTYTTDDGKFYVHNYGDDRLVKWLDANGYECAGTLPLGTRLYTWVYTEDDRDPDYAFDLVHPYLDGKNDRVDLITESGKLAFVIQNEGDELCSASGSLGIDHLPFCCNHCGAFADTTAYPKYAPHPIGNYYVQLCKDCAKDNVVTLDAGTPYADKVYSKYVWRGSLVFTPNGELFTHNGELFTREGLSHLGLVVVDGRVVPESETATCFVSGVTFLKGNLVDISDYPQVVLDTYAQQGVPPMANLAMLPMYGRALSYIPHPVTGSAYAHYRSINQLDTNSGTEYVLTEHRPDVMTYLADGTVQGALLEYPMLLDIARRVKALRDAVNCATANVSSHLNNMACLLCTLGRRINTAED